MRNITTRKKCLDCKICCTFDKKERFLLPYLSDKEFKKIKDKKVFLKKNGMFQIIPVYAKKTKGMLKCPFLKESSYSCTIYKNRPLECQLWPFVIGQDKAKKKIGLWVVNNKWCPAVDENSVTNKKFVHDLAKSLENLNIPKKIINREVFVWPYQSYWMPLFYFDLLQK